MFIKRLQMLNYRNYNALDIELCPNVNVFMGDNAQGKTNILEATVLLQNLIEHQKIKSLLIGMVNMHL